jgi:hypothetical protein
MTRDKHAANRRTQATKQSQPAERIPVRLAPTDDPAETVERLLSRRQLIVEDGDVVIAREGAGLARGTAVASLSGPSSSQYRLNVRGQQDDIRRVYAAYERAVVDGEAYAAERRVRLFYAEETSFTLLKDYRPPATKK